jgi:hypothetical protein
MKPEEMLAIGARFGLGWWHPRRDQWSRNAMQAERVKKRNEESVFGMEVPSLSSLSVAFAGYTPRSVTHGVTGSPSLTRELRTTEWWLRSRSQAFRSVAPLWRQSLFLAW